jgi:hypothetical protein
MLSQDVGNGQSAWADLAVCSLANLVFFGGALLHVDTFAHNKSGIAYQSKNRRSETVVNHKGEPLLFDTEAAVGFVLQLAQFTALDLSINWPNLPIYGLVRRRSPADVGVCS